MSISAVYDWEWDIPEPRAALERIVLSADGTSWDMAASSGVWRDPVTQSVFLRPLCKTPEWLTTFTGDYARLAKADMTFVDGTLWVETHRAGGDGDLYLTAPAPTNDPVVTSATYPANQAWVLSAYHDEGNGSADQVVLDCGWCNTATPGATDGDLALRFWSDGVISLWQTVSGAPVCLWRGDLQGGAAAPGRVRGTPKAKGGQTVQYLIIPCRAGEILVVASDGQGAIVPLLGAIGQGRAFNSALTGTAPPTITPASKFFFHVPPPGSPCVQLAPVKFVTGGALYSPVIDFRYPLTTADTRAWAYLLAGSYAGRLTSATGASVLLRVVDPASDAAIEPNVTAVSAAQGRLKISMLASPDKTATPVIYAADASLAAIGGTTSDETQDGTCLLTALSMDADESGRITASLTGRVAVSPSGAVNLYEAQEGRTGRLKATVTKGSLVRSYSLFRGHVSEPVTLTYVNARRAANRAVGAFKLSDRTALLDESQFADTLPYDGLALTGVLASLWADIGVGVGALNMSSLSFDLPFSESVSSGDWQYLPERLDTRGQWLDKLISECTPLFLTGWRPLPPSSGSVGLYRWSFAAPADFPTAPACAVYCLSEDRPAGGGFRLFNYALALIPPEVNQVAVVGFAPYALTEAGRYPTAQRDDGASQAPGTAKASRPATWRGRTLRYQLIDPAVSSQGAADDFADLLESRLMAGTVKLDWSGDVLFDEGTLCPLWKGDIARVVFPGATQYADFRLTAPPSLQVSPATGKATAKYQGRRVGQGSLP